MLEKGLEELGLEGPICVTNNISTKGKLQVCATDRLDKPYELKFFKFKKNGELSANSTYLNGMPILYTDNTYEKFFNQLSEVFTPIELCKNTQKQCERE